MEHLHLLSGNHREFIQFNIISSPHSPVVLGLALLKLHKLLIDWSYAKFVSWSPFCHSTCLQSACSKKEIAVSPVSPVAPEVPDLSSIPTAYNYLGEVFSKQRALSLPPHHPYDCAIEMFPGAPLSSSRTICPFQRVRAWSHTSRTLIITAGIIRPSSFPVGAVFFLVSKKDRNVRPCIDFRGLNNITVKNKYPLPLINSAFETLQGATIISKLDLRNAYHLVRIREEDEWKKAFSTPLGHFEYLVMSFGLTYAPAVFQTLLNDVLRDFINRSVYVYIYDILVFSRNIEEHVIQM